MHIPLKEYSAPLATYLRPLRRRMGVLALLIFTSTGVQLVSPQIVRHFIDQAVQGAAPSQLAFAALCFLGADMVGVCFRSARPMSAMISPGRLPIAYAKT